MKKPKSIFYIIYLLFHVGLLVGAIYMNYKSEDFEFLLWLRSKMVIMTYVAVFGLVLFLVDIVLITMEARNHKLEKERLNGEINALKAKMFDLQEATKPATTQSKAEHDEHKGSTED